MNKETRQTLVRMILFLKSADSCSTTDFWSELSDSSFKFCESVFTNSEASTDPLFFSKT